MRQSAIALFAALPSALLAQTCLEEVSVFAERICGEIQNSGIEQVTEINGKLKGEVSGIIRRVLGGGSGEINVDHLSKTFEGVARDKLGQDRFNIVNCRKEMVYVGRQDAQACKPKVVANVCRHRDFGQVGWERENITHGTLRRGGGFNPDAWCSVVINNYVKAHSLGQDYKATILGKAESRRKKLDGSVRYTYHCRVKIESGPIYAEREDPSRCGTRVVSSVTKYPQ